MLAVLQAVPVAVLSACNGGVAVVKIAFRRLQQHIRAGAGLFIDLYAGLFEIDLFIQGIGVIRGQAALFAIAYVAVAIFDLRPAAVDRRAGQLFAVGHGTKGFGRRAGLLIYL